MDKRDSLKEMVDAHTSDENGRARGPLARLRGYLIAGIVVTTPVAITVFLTYKLLALVDHSAASLIPRELYEGALGGTLFPGLGIAVALVFFIVAGYLATNFLGRVFIRLYEYLLDRVPVIRTLYGGIKQIIETVMASQSSAFRDVVMLEYPRRGSWSVGFVTGKTEGEPQRLTDREMINVFVPTTPNPTSGFLLFVPRDDLRFLNMSVEEGIKLVVSAGIIAPPDPETTPGRGARQPDTRALRGD